MTARPLDGADPGRPADRGDRRSGDPRAAASEPGPSSTQGLLSAAGAGDQEAWHALYRRYDRVLRVILGRRMHDVARNRFDTEDVMQSTFLSAWEALDTFEYRGPESFRRWLTEILLHKLADKVKHHGRGRRDPGREMGPPSAIDDVPSPDDTPSVILARVEGQRQLLAALAELPVIDQEIVGLRFFENRTWPEIAARLGMAEATARRHMLEALERLFRRLV